MARGDGGAASVSGDAGMGADAAFRRRLARRGRWRWGLSGSLIAAYLAWGVLGIYFPYAYATPVAGSALPRGMAVGLLIILLSIVLSVVYVRVVSRIESDARREQTG